MVSPIFPPGPSATYNRPSLFELIAQDQLRDLLHPLVRYVLTYFTQRYPRYLLRVLNHHEEFFACLLLLVERHHLKRHDASLSEHFYKLKLTPTSSIRTPRLAAFQPPSRRLSRRQRWGLLLFLVGIPYIRTRAQDYYERMGGGQDIESVPEEAHIVPVSKAARLFKSMYPYVNLSVDVTFLAYDLAYLFNRTEYYRPWHGLLGVRVERKGPDDESTPSSIFDRLPPLIPPLLLLLKLSQWWYSPSSPRSIALQQSTSSTASLHASIVPPRPLPILPSSGIIPPLTPPSTPPPSASAAPLPSSSASVLETAQYTVTKETFGVCPLCTRKWQNPSILPSGWVVCWRCGWDAIEEDGKCPITGVEVGPGQLRRVLV